MMKFFVKYELPLKIIAIIVWIYGAIDNFFFDTSDENRNFDLFVGIVKLFLAVFFLFDVIALVKKRRMKNNPVK